MSTPVQLNGLNAPIPFVSKYVNFARFLLDPIGIMTKGHERFGNLFSLYPAESGQMIIALGPEYCKALLQDVSLFYITSDVGDDNESIQALMFGLPLMNGDLHRQRRRLMMPAFHRQYIDNYRDDMVNIARKMLDFWHEGDVRDIATDMQQVTLEIAVRTLLGCDSDDESRAIGNLLHQWMTMGVNPVNLFFKLDIAGLPYHKFKTVSEKLYTHLEHFLAKKRENPGHDVLSTLIQARDEDGIQLDDRELIGQATVLFFAGHATTANAMIWTLFLLAQHPKVMAKLLDELETLVGEPPTVDQLNSLPYLEYVIKESLRLLPPTPYSLRVSQREFELGGYQFPQYTVVWFGNYISHRMQDTYDEPLKFMPERWGTIRPTAYEYMPFHTGPRMCIGAPFAMMEMKIILAMIVQRYRLTCLQDSRVDYTVRITLRPKKHLRLQVHNQDRNFIAVPVKGNIHEILDLPN